MANSIQYDFRVLDRFSGPLAKMARSMSKMSSAVSKGNQKLSVMGKKIKGIGDKMTNMQTALAGVGAVAAMKSLFDQSVKMENAIADVGKVSDMSKAQLAKLRLEMENLAEQIGRPAEGLAKIAFEGKKLGTTDKELIPFVKTVAKMAVAFDMTEDAAGAAIGSIRAKMGLSMQEVIKFGDATNQLANTMATTGENIIEIVQRTSGIMKTLKVPPEVAAGFAAFADQVEVSAELGASGLNMMMNRMMVMPGMMNKLLKDPVKAVRGEMEKLAKMPEAKRARVIFKKFGQESGRFVLKLTSNMELFDKTIATAMSKGAIGSMDKEMKNVLERTGTKFEMSMIKMKNSLRILGDALAPFILQVAGIFSSIVKGFGEFAKAHPTLTKFVAGLMIIFGIASMLLFPLGMIATGIGSIFVAVTTILPALAALKLAILGINTAFLASPITWIVAGITAAVGAVWRLISAWDELKAAWVEGGFFKAAAKFFGFGGDEEPTRYPIPARNAVSSAIKTRVAEQNVNVGGVIKVAAEPGTKVTNAMPDLNVGQNMRFAY